MGLPIYPGRDALPGLKYGQKWSPAFFNQSSTTATGKLVGVGLSPYPQHTFELEYEVLRDGLYEQFQQGEGLEFWTLAGLFLSMNGTLGRFLYKALHDHRVTQNVVGVTDGINATWPLTRTRGANGNFGAEPVGQVVWPGSDLGGDGFNLYLNGSATPVPPATYTVSTATPGANTVTFNAVPAQGQQIAVDMSYYFLCRFHKDTNTFEKFMDKLWNSTVTIVSDRP
jgi:hypothetical protein